MDVEGEGRGERTKKRIPLGAQLDADKVAAEAASQQRAVNKQKKVKADEAAKGLEDMFAKMNVSGGRKRRGKTHKKQQKKHQTRRR